MVPFAYGQKAPALIDAAPATCGIGTMEGYIFLQKRAAGTDLKALGAVLQRAPAGFMSLRAAGIASARDFAGHIVGEFPHARIPGEKNSFVIAPENPGRLRDLDSRGHVRHWILEVHLVDASRSFGGFYEELITV